MVGQVDDEGELDERLELVHSACHQVISGTGKVNRPILRKALSSLGHALGYSSEPGAGARNRTGKADLVWKREGGPDVAIAIDRGLRVMDALLKGLDERELQRSLAPEERKTTVTVLGGSSLPTSWNWSAVSRQATPSRTRLATRTRFMLAGPSP